MKPRYALLTALWLGAALVACSSDQTSPNPAEGWLSAMIQTPAAAENSKNSYNGTGFFRSSADFPGWPDQAPELFFLYSAGAGDSEGKEFTITRNSAEPPAVGRYPIGWSEDGQWGWNVHYTDIRGDSIEFFAATGGELEITDSSPERIEGRFTFQVVHGLTCATEWRHEMIEPGEFPELPCSMHLELDSPATEISGSFSVVRGLPCDERDTIVPTNVVGRLLFVNICLR